MRIKENALLRQIPSENVGQIFFARCFVIFVVLVKFVIRFSILNNARNMSFHLRGILKGHADAITSIATTSESHDMILSSSRGKY